jgi:hypothetical protein
MPQKRSKERRKVNLLAAADATTTEMPRRCCTAAGPTAAAGAARSDVRLPAAAAVTATPEVAEREARARRAIFFREQFRRRGREEDEAGRERVREATDFFFVSPPSPSPLLSLSQLVFRKPAVPR